MRTRWDIARDRLRSRNALPRMRRGDGTYKTDVVRAASAAIWADQVETGTYAISGSTLTTTPEQSSCPTPDPPKTYTFSFQNGDLVLSSSTGVVVYPPQGVSDAGGSVIIVIGCFEASGFVASPLADASTD